VEHNRWAYGSSDHSFNEYFAVSSNSVRGKAVKEKNQQEVWDAVEDITTKQGGESATGTYAGLENSEDYNEMLQEYLLKKHRTQILRLAQSIRQFAKCLKYLSL
jgi:ribosomal protein S24E